MKIETESGMLKSQLQDKERQAEKDRVLLADFKETLTNQFIEKEAKIAEEKLQAVSKAEGQAKQLHDASESLEKLNAKAREDNQEMKKLNEQLKQTRGQLAQLQTQNKELKDKQFSQVIDSLNSDLQAEMLAVIAIRNVPHSMSIAIISRGHDFNIA